ncbi:ATP-dependent rRNA helicase SPB4 [Cryptococcus amylolentus CBS 6039]|uniref:ATP-dependent RNA helicase n=2 Tax=Cryptococcus amylolentus TaxID=104669 RepID=A0A1E3HWH3_9TREE|nr:ATP-dependent rRNA helicase SPB4 [Cryptococcus amylolentus CBS 6039]ODN80662.1 ATP-dependent rRNA helicase SPB4 [Cryptococcus amylolentus CBS 6039]ODO09216.1 ATP-dependent rRNA helicase SPB4 [Cryptococcus amylolentus CBS 6273]
MDKPVGKAPSFAGSWTRLNPPLSPWISNEITKMGFTKMTPVQAGTIPRAIKNQDCVVEAVTGSGKTLSFVIPVLERLSKRDYSVKRGEVAAIVIAPTRELAHQINAVFNQFLSALVPPEPEVDENGEPIPVASSSRSPSPEPYEKPQIPLSMLITSGTPTPYETFQATSPAILVGTPGRLASFLLNPRGLSLVKVSDFDVLVLDEADRLLSSPDHRRDVERIMKHLPKQRRTHLFSATMTDAVEDMIGLGLRNPVRIVVNLKEKQQAGEEQKERRTPMALQNTYLTCRNAEKTLQLIRLLQSESRAPFEASKYIVYFSTCAAVDYFYRVLSRLPRLSKFHLTSLHGDLPPKIRETALETFTTHPSSCLNPSVLLCTDVAARGVDFNDIDVVIQYDPPTDPKTFSHRAGRTARAGRKGKAVVLLAKGREEDYVGFLETRKIPLTEHAYVSADLEPVPMPSTLDPAAVDLMKEIRKIILTDRELADKGAKTFVSAYRAYSKHEASFIFRTADLDFHQQGIAYGLLRLPAMPEIKDWRKKREAEKKKIVEWKEEGKDVEEKEDISWEDEEVNWDTFGYTSKQREQARLTTLAQKAAAKTSVAALAAKAEARAKRKIKAEMREAWSDKKDRKARKEERHDKRDKRKQAEWEREQAEGEGEGQQGDLERIIRMKEREAREAKRRKLEEEEDDSADEAMGKEYQSLKREVKEERKSRKANKGGEAVSTGGMFDDLE